jgi:argininosuccinate synthase
MKKTRVEKIVIAYSGGLDTSAIIPWLKENYQDCQVIAFVADIGQSRSELDGIEKKALQSGATACEIVDMKKEFVSEYVYPMFQTGALYEGNYLLGTAIARPLIAKAQVKLALRLGADAVCHGATGKGNDQVRFEKAYAALAPELKVIAPWRKWDLSSREELLSYLKDRNIPTDASLEKIYSRDQNSLHISTEGGPLENSWNEPKKDCWVWSSNPIDAPDTPETVKLSIRECRVVAIDGKQLKPYQCLERLNLLGARHGIGRIDIIENRFVGMKSRGCYETPGGTIIN